MVANVYPVDAVTGAPNYSGRMARQTLGALVGKNTTRPLGARSGIHPATPASTVTATSSTWTVTAFGGVLDVEATAVEGPYLFSFDANVTGSVNAADATNPRIDLLSVQLSDPASGDGTVTPGVAIVYTVGTPNASPVAPATPARALALAQITVPQSGGGSPSTVIVAPYLTATGGIVPARTSAEYPAAPYTGQYVDDANLGLLRWNGSSWDGAWASYTPSTPNWLIGSTGVSTGRWTRIGKTVYYRIYIAPAGTGIAYNSSPVQVSLPVTASSALVEQDCWLKMWDGTTNFAAAAYIPAGATFATILNTTSQTDTRLQAMTTSTHYISAGGNLAGTLIYEAA